MAPIIRVLVEIALFLEFADPGQMDKGEFGKILESIGGAISDLRPEDRAAFDDVVLEMANAAESPQEAGSFALSPGIGTSDRIGCSSDIRAR